MAEILSGEGQKEKQYLDPRTKLMLLLMVAIFVLGGAGGNDMIWARIVLAFVPILLLLINKQFKAVLIFSGLFGAGCILQYVLLGSLTGFVNSIVLATAGILTTFIPGLMMGY